ncbi:MAG TPA: response regulator, partial [Nitrospiraceae bacterium]|nr:response regulator [Nitrospiraceae bacterium]
MGSYNDKIALHRRPVRTPNLMSPGSGVSSTCMPSSVIRLLIVTDYPVVRHGLRQIFGGATDIHIVAEARGAADSMKQIGACRPDAVLLDFEGKASYDLFCQSQMHHGHLPILIFSTAYDRYAKKAFHRGAMGYITKDHAPDHLVLAIRGIVAGERYVWPPIVLG